MPAAVISVKVASQTSAGSTQCAVRSQRARWRWIERACRLLDGLEPLPQVERQCLGESGADAAVVDQLPAVVTSHEESTEPSFRPLLIGEAADDEQAAAKTLDLSPAVAAPGKIGQVPPLRDDSLEPHAAHLLEDIRPTAFDVLGVADASGFRWSEKRQQARLSRVERQPADSLAFQMDQIEGEVHEALSLRPRGDGLLHRLEAAAPVREHDHQLAVDQGVSQAERANRFHHLRKFGGPVESVPADQPDAAILDETPHPVAIELDLMDPLVSSGRRASSVSPIEEGTRREPSSWTRQRSRNGLLSRRVVQ